MSMFSRDVHVSLSLILQIFFGHVVILVESRCRLLLCRLHLCTLAPPPNIKVGGV
jgi:hypothetical protein